MRPDKKFVRLNYTTIMKPLKKNIVIEIKELVERA
jgi:hypothetical protein